MENTRSQAAKLLSTSDDRIGFVNSTSHGLSWIAESLPLREGDGVLVPDCEFPANRFPWKNLERKGIKFQTVPTRNGTVTTDRIYEAISNSTRVLSMSSVQFHTGFRADLETIGSICRDEDIYFVVDAIQSLGWDDLKPEKLGIDALVADGHKWMCGPEGAGIIYLDESFQETLSPALAGWHSVENRYNFDDPVFNFRSDAGVVEMGSRNTIGLIALGESLDLLLAVGLSRIRSRIERLREDLTKKLVEKGFSCRHKDWPEKNCSPIVSLAHPEFPEDGAVKFCRDRKVQLSRRGSRIRVGIHFYNNNDDINQLIDVLDELRQ